MLIWNREKICIGRERSLNEIFHFMLDNKLLTHFVLKDVNMKLGISLQFRAVFCIMIQVCVCRYSTWNFLCLCMCCVEVFIVKKVLEVLTTVYKPRVAVFSLAGFLSWC